MQFRTNDVAIGKPILNRKSQEGTGYNPLFVANTGSTASGEPILCEPSDEPKLWDFNIPEDKLKKGFNEELSFQDVCLNLNFLIKANSRDYKTYKSNGGKHFQAPDINIIGINIRRRKFFYKEPISFEVKHIDYYKPSKLGQGKKEKQDIRTKWLKDWINREAHFIGVNQDCPLTKGIIRRLREAGKEVKLKSEFKEFLKSFRQKTLDEISKVKKYTLLSKVFAFFKNLKDAFMKKLIPILLLTFINGCARNKWIKPNSVFEQSKNDWKNLG